MDKFLASYIETALWSSMDNNDQPLDSLDAELAPETLKRFENDCEAFIKAVAGIIDANTSEYPVAHDFWLTRNGHGAGFWDGDYPEPLATELTKIAESFGECSLYVGDDGRIYA